MGVVFGNARAGERRWIGVRVWVILEPEVCHGQWNQWTSKRVIWDLEKMKM